MSGPARSAPGEAREAGGEGEPVVAEAGPGGALSWIPGALSKLEAQGLRRGLEPLGSPQGPVVRLGGAELVNLCSNDYLGLAAHPRVREAAAARAREEGAGAGASRLVCGDLPAHRALEERLARLKGKEAALLFGSGYHANCGVPAALTGKDDAIFSDVLNHASIVDGCRLSFARTVRYRHKDLDELADLLARTRARRKLVVTDAVFSMDGDAAPLAELVALCERHGAMLYVDEAHATGLLGARGGGLCEALGLSARVDVVMGTLGKALGSYGAVVAGSRDLREWLVSRARTFVFSTALPPAACAAALAALDLLDEEPERRTRLEALSARMKAGLTRLGFDQREVVAPIFPVILGEERVALEASRRLRERGYLVRAIRPPTVPAGTSRLRVTLSAAHTPAQVDGFLGALADALADLPR